MKMKLWKHINKLKEKIMDRVYTYEYQLQATCWSEIKVNIYIHYEYNEGQDCAYCNEWISSIPGISPEIVLRGVQVIEIPSHPELERWLTKNPAWSDAFNKSILSTIESKLADPESELYQDLLNYV